MRPLAPEDWKTGGLFEASRRSPMARLRPLVAPGFKGSEVQGYDPAATSRLLDEAAQACVAYTGADLLAEHDTQVALINAAHQDVWCRPDLGQVVMTSAFLEAIWFVASTYSLFTATRRLIGHSLELGLGERPDLVAFQGMLFKLQTTRLTLHIIGQLPAPDLRSMLPPRLRLSTHGTVALTTAFVLLHEQAHCQAGRDPELVQAWRRRQSLAGAPDISPEWREEFFADSWALTRAPMAQRGEFLKPVIIFFANQWIVDLLAYSAFGSHPHVADRLTQLAKADFGSDAADIVALANRFSPSVESFFSGLEARPVGERYEALIERSLIMADADDGLTYDVMAKAVCEQYEAVLDAQPR